MRKGYGPTGISFHYPFDTFKADVKKGKQFRVELVIGGNCFYPEFNLSESTESELKAFFDKADHYSLECDRPTIQIIAN